MEKYNKQMRFHSVQVVSSQSGYVTLVSVLGILLLLTIIGLSMVNIAITDKQIVRNDLLTKRNFYLAESGANEAAQTLENANTTIEDTTAGLSWVAESDEGIDFTERDTWLDSGDNSWETTGSSVSVPSAVFYNIAGTPDPSTDSNTTHANANLTAFYNAAAPRDDIHFAAKSEGVSQGSSLVVTNTSGRLYLYYTYGMYSNQNSGLGEALIEEGYKKRF